MHRALVLLLALSIPAAAQAGGRYTLESGELTYFVSHPLHKVSGVSTEIRGKGVCGATCDFLAAATLESFHSGDANRDAHMMQAMRGGAHPLVVVRATLPSEPGAGPLNADLDVEMSGQKVHYAAVPFELEESNPGHYRLTGTVPMRLKDFRIKAPSLMGMAVKDEVPVRVALNLKRE